jgi:hypothetical protein
MGLFDDIPILGPIAKDIEDGAEWIGGQLIKGVEDLSGGDLSPITFVADGIKYIVDHTQFWTEVGLVLGTGVTLLVPGGEVFGPLIAIAGLVKDLLTRMREMTDLEIAFANQVFQGTIPYDRVVLTDAAGLGGRFFTTPSLQPGSDKILVNIGGAFDAPTLYTSPRYPASGQVFIHELTHAWQIAHSSFVPGLVCEGIWNQTQYSFGTDVYAVPTDRGKEWSEYNQEQQGQLVDKWYQGYQSRGHRYYGYVKANIRAGSQSASCSLFSLFWRWCSKCQGLFNNILGWVGVCPAGEAHALEPYFYMLRVNSDDPPHLSEPSSTGGNGLLWVGGWRLCHNCRGLVNLKAAGVKGTGVCPAGEGHSLLSPQWALPLAVGVNAYGNCFIKPEPLWDECMKCNVLFYNSADFPSVCPAGGSHKGTTGLKFVLEMYDP